MSLLLNLPTKGLLSQLAEKAVRHVSPRRHVQTRDSLEGQSFQVVHTDKTNILIRSLQQKRRRNAVGGVGGHTEVASAAFHGGSSDKGKKRACDESSRARQGAKRPLLLASSPAAPHREGRAEAAFPGGSSTRSAGKAEDLGGPELREERSAEKQTLRGAKGRAGRSKVEEDESQGKSADAEGKGRL